MNVFWRSMKFGDKSNWIFKQADDIGLPAKASDFVSSIWPARFYVWR